MKFRLIEDQRDTFPVRVVCDVMGVSPAGYYAWRGRPESPRKVANRALLTEIRRVHTTHRGRYGAPRIHAALRADGQTASRSKKTTPGVARIAFSTRSTQEPQAMPSTRMLKAAGFFGLETREDIDVSFTNDLVRCWPVGS